MVADYEEGPERSRARALRGVVPPGRRRGSLGRQRRAGGPEEWVAARARELEEAEYSIHMHVWTQAEFLQLILALPRALRRGLRHRGRRPAGDRVHRRPAQAGPCRPAAPAAAPAAPRRPTPLGAARSCEFPRQAGAREGPQREIRAPEATTIVRRTSPGPEAPLAIEARGLKKSFRIPTHRVDSIKERIVHPFAATTPRLRALDGISFDIRQGEFFGIVGRNGSGKSTLLKLLASIYRADAGTIRMAGRLAPFIELGVGFNEDLTARENVLLNGVMMGLTPKETRDRLDAVIEFAELEEFVELKLKNYSSGMLVRLAFSVMLQADADVLLIDEVLAVGDAAFQQKCADAFHEMKAEGKTIVLVTHEMTTVEEYCHRAMLIDGGKIQHIGDPDEVGRDYLQLNFERGSRGPGGSADRRGREVRLLDAWIEDAEGERV